FYQHTNNNKNKSLSLHDALPIYEKYVKSFVEKGGMTLKGKLCLTVPVSLLLLFMFITIENKTMRIIIIIMWLAKVIVFTKMKTRSEEHTSELQSRFDIVCRLLLE